jgi:hypothetical protein
MALTPLPAGTVAIVTAVLAVWNLFVMEFLARIAHDFIKRYEGVPAEYVGRKVVHILGGGITTLLIPVVFDGY